MNKLIACMHRCHMYVLFPLNALDQAQGRFWKQTADQTLNALAFENLTTYKERNCSQGKDFYFTKT
jgi:hypothetical protein